MDVAKRKEFLSAEIEKAKIELEGVRKNHAAATREFQRLNTGWKNWVGNKELAMAEGNMANMKRRFDEGFKGVQALEAALEALNQQGADPALPEEAPGRQDPLGNAALLKDIDEVVNSLREQAAALEEVGALKMIAKLQSRGATDEQLREARTLAEQINKIKETNRLKEEAAKITEGLMTPQEKFIKQQEDLTKMFMDNLIGIDTFKRGLMEARTEMMKDMVIKFRSTGIDAVLADSNEAMQRLAEYRRSLEQPKDVPKMADPAEVNRKRIEQWENTASAPRRPSVVGGKENEVAGQMVDLLGQIAVNTKESGEFHEAGIRG
jgi:hypothetical protein